MKQIYLLFISLFLCSSIQGQESFPTENAIWNVEWEGYNFQILYGLHGDTIIQDIHYKKLYMLNDTLLHIDDKDEYYGGIRIDGKKVYFRLREDNDFPKIDSETLLYDFSKEVGDKIQHGLVEHLYAPVAFYGLLPHRASIYQCESIIKEIYIDKYARKHFKLEFDMEGQSGEDEWIEGIGSLSGFFWAYHALISGWWKDYSYNLQCLKVNSEVVYLNEDSYCQECFLHNDAGEYNFIEIKKNNHININYESSTHMLNFISREPILNFEFQLFDLVGRKIKSFELSDISYSNIYVGDLLPGLYNYCLINEKGKKIQTGKIIIN